MRNDRYTRREFTARSAAVISAVGFGSFIPPEKSQAAEKQPKTAPVGLQLYTLRELTEKDFTGTLKKVAAIGYDGVEFAGYGGLSAVELKKLIDDLGLKCAGTHEGFENLEKKLDETIAFNAGIGSSFIICPSMPGEWRDKGAEGFKAFGERMNKIGAAVKKAGMQLCYHNHNFEFKKENDKFLIEYLYETADPELVKAEVDVYWVQFAGENPAAFIRRYGKRCILIHMKDMADDADRSFAPVGTGVLDMKSIVRASKEANAAWFIVEQDRTKRPPLEAVGISLKNMRTLLKS
ncbi:sugar phosphate isomerase/epimerase [bacterium]|nr:sugar phosphate isomerase/epimerase [bacterium]